VYSGTDTQAFLGEKAFSFSLYYAVLYGYDIISGGTRRKLEGIINHNISMFSILDVEPIVVVCYIALTRPTLTHYHFTIGLARTR